MDRHVRRRLALSTAVVVAAAVGLAGAPAQADPTTGSIIGQVVTDTGARAAGVRLTAVGNSFGSGVTDADGNYRLDNLAPGDYRLRVEPRAGMSQYANQKRFYFQADVFAVRAGESTSVNETLLPRGAMRGRLVDTDGSPLGGVQVAISYLDGSAFLDTSTDADGRWLFEDIFAGRYQVKFDDYGRGIHQSAFGRTGIAKPDPVTVIAGQAAEVNDTAVARTSMRITATDSLSGAQVMSFSAFAAGSFASSDTGELLLSPVQAGTHRVDVFADGYLGAFNDISLVPGEIAQLAVRLVPQSSIEATVVDAQTGQPVPGICVDAHQLTLAVAHTACGSVSEADGKVKVSGLRAGAYQLFANPVDGTPHTYGAQWVGFGRGTGRQPHAKSFVVGTGETLQGPVIRLDRAGTISGRVSTPDGSALSWGDVGVLAADPISGGSIGVPIDAEGRYTIDFLGPYDWPLFFQGSDQAPQWSGRVGDRYLAQHIRVTSAAVTTYDFTFKPAVTLVATIQGEAPTWLLVYNAVTGDIVTSAGVVDNGRMRMPIVGPQLVKLLGITDMPGGSNGWVGGSDFLHAQPFWIPASGTRTVTISF